MISLDDPNLYVLFALTTFIFAGGILVSMAFDVDSSPSDCVLEGAAHASNTNEVVETAVIQEDEEDEDDEDDDDDDSDEEPDTDEEDRIVGRKVNRLLLDTIDTLLDIRKAREERAAKRLKVE